jgi:hypothetical protein
MEKEIIKTYVLLSETWYYHIDRQIGGSDVIDEVMLQLHYSNGELGEIAIRWYSLQNRLVPKIEVFNDSWESLTQIKDILEDMALVSKQNITSKQFCDLVEKHGFVDATARKHPYEIRRSKHGNMV